MYILYGISKFQAIDVTELCISRKTSKNIINIPSGDCERANIFTDPYVGILKKIFIIFNDIQCIKEFDHTVEININLSDYTIDSFSIIDIDNRLSAIHSKLQLNYGTFLDELPEQKMVLRSLSGKEKILELGSNIGRNSLVMASILENSENLVTLESDTEISERLKDNRDINNFKFHVENAALSNRKLIQQGWSTIPSEILIEGYKPVNTISLVDLQNKYKIDFDTLVIDCEGAFYYILMDMPEILNNINLIIMENDYIDPMCKLYVDDVFKSNDFYRYYVESGGWGPCYHNFYEIWKKK
jgi:FkbM family methyltransferase